MNDENIVYLYLKRNESAISETKQIYGKKLNRLSYNIVKNMEDATECESDTYLKAWNTIPPNEPKKYLFSYLAKITRNVSINLYNKGKSQKRFAHIVELTHEMEECIPNPSDDFNVLESFLTDVINKFLYTLGDTERTVFVKRYWFAESIKDVANATGFSESKIKSMLMRTRNKMKKYFESEGVEI